MRGTDRAARPFLRRSHPAARGPGLARQRPRERGERGGGAADRGGVRGVADVLSALGCELSAVSSGLWAVCRSREPRAHREGAALLEVLVPSFLSQVGGRCRLRRRLTSSWWRAVRPAPRPPTSSHGRDSTCSCSSARTTRATRPRRVSEPAGVARARDHGAPRPRGGAGAAQLTGMVVRAPIGALIHGEFRRGARLPGLPRPGLALPRRTPTRSSSSAHSGRRPAARGRARTDLATDAAGGDRRTRARPGGATATVACAARSGCGRAALGGSRGDSGSRGSRRWPRRMAFVGTIVTWPWRVRRDGPSTRRLRGDATWVAGSRTWRWSPRNARCADER